MEAPVIASIITSSVSVVVIGLQFVSNRKLNKENEALKSLNQQQLEDAKRKSDLIKNIEVAKQEYLKQVINNTYALRRAIQEFPYKEIHSLKDIRRNMKMIDEINTRIIVLDEVYRSAVYLNPFFGDTVSSFMHDLLKHYAILKSEMAYANEDREDISGRHIERIIKSIESIANIVRTNESSLKQFIHRAYSERPDRE